MQYHDILNRVAAGERMSEEEFIHLFHQGDLLQIACCASEARQKKLPGNIVSFIIDRNINYTNICSCQCLFCGFYRSDGDADAYVLSRKELYGKIDEARALGATQLMIQGGLNPDLTIEFFENMFRAIKGRYDMTIHSLSAPEVDYVARISGLGLDEALLRLKEAGLDSLPGGGAEILHDDIRQSISPHKISTARWLQVMQCAHRAGLESTATMMMGTVEEIGHRVDHLRRIRELQDQTGGFRSFIAWTYQGGAGTRMLKNHKVTALEYLRFLALARLYLDNVKHIQGSWLTQGAATGQMSLFFGADDLGSIMLEENVVRSVGVKNRLDLAAMIELIRQAGFIPGRRDTQYNIVETYE